MLYTVLIYDIIILPLNLNLQGFSTSMSVEEVCNPSDQHCPEYDVS